jgi:hypothetical protein
MLSENTLSRLAEVGLSETDVLAATPRPKRDYTYLGNYVTLGEVREVSEGKPSDAELVVDEDGSIRLEWDRPETLFEAAERLINEAKIVRAREQRDREEYERLKGKYEGESMTVTVDPLSIPSHQIGRGRRLNIEEE